jgi:hypothetical protein
MVHPQAHAYSHKSLQNTPSYELHPCLINMVQDQTFLGEDDEDPYSHLNEFEQTCACLYIVGMLDETL